MQMQGKVKSGLSNAKYWVQKIEKVFFEKTKFKLYHGTLNVELQEPYRLENTTVIKKEEYGGSQDVYVKKCKINGYPSYILRSEKNEIEQYMHPHTIIEIVSDINLREKFCLKDEETVIIED